MKKIKLTSLGQKSESGSGIKWDDLVEAGNDRKIIDALVPDSQPTEVQVRAIQEAKILTSRRNLLISSTTNSGKTLLGYLALFRGLDRGRRVLLLEPLRALAEEKASELNTLASLVEVEPGKKISVEITTGDYRLNNERMQSAPPEAGQIVVATPERIESILRNPSFDEWIDSISLVVVDEAHMLGDPMRGAALEYVLTSMKMLRRAPRFILLSATLGDTESLENWLSPCDTLLSDLRMPPLHRSLVVMAEDDDLSEELSRMISEILSDPEASVLVFVYQTAAADKLARDLSSALKSDGEVLGPKAYHSRQSAATRDGVRQAFLSGDCRCVVSTTALAMGVNLPATHVILRDLTRGPGGRVRADELIQMSGRAGRGYREGHSILVMKPKDSWTEEALVEALETDRLPAIRSALVPEESASSFGRSEVAPPALSKPVLSLLSRDQDKGLKTEELEKFIRSTLAGEEALVGLAESLQWLSGPSRLLVICEDDRWKATMLGRRSIQSSAPLDAAAGVAQLVRDLLSVDSDDIVLKGFSKLDLLILTELVSTGVTTRLRYSDKLADQVDAWMGQSSEKSILFTKWIRGAEGFSQAEELLGSLGIANGSTGPTRRNHRKDAYLATCRAILLWQRGQGVSSADVMRRWGIKDLEGVEEKWRDNRLFLLSALASIWEIRCFYYHLREECSADDERVHRVKRAMQRMGAHTYQLLDLLAWCSPLGPLFVRMRRALASGKGAVPARATLRKLEEQGVASVSALRDLDASEFKALGIRSDLAKTIGAFVRRGG